MKEQCQSRLIYCLDIHIYNLGKGTLLHRVTTSTETQWFMESAASFEGRWSSCCSSFYSICCFCLSSLVQFLSQDRLKMEIPSSDTHRFWKNRTVTSQKLLLIAGKCDFFLSCSVNSCCSRMIFEIQGKNSRDYFKHLNVNQELSSIDLVAVENSLEQFLILSNTTAFAMHKKFLGICHSIDFVLLS